MAKLTDEMKRYISTMHMDEEKTTTEILRGFGDRFGYLPSASTVNKYQFFNENNPIKEEKPDDEPEEDEEEEGEEGTITTKKKDTRLEKDLVDISDGIEEEDFKRLTRVLEKSNRETWELLAKATRKGYTKVNVATGDIEK